MKFNPEEPVILVLGALAFVVGASLDFFDLLAPPLAAMVVAVLLDIVVVFGFWREGRS